MRGVLPIVAGRSMALAGTLLVPVVLVRVLDPAGFGTYKQLLLLHATLYAAAQLGMAESLYFFLPGTPHRAGAYVANALVALVAAGALCAALLVLLAAPLASALANAPLAAHAPLLAALVGLTLASAPFEIVQVARSRHGAAARTYALSDLARAALVIAPALALGRVEWVLAGAVAFAALRLLALVAWVRRELGGALRPDGAALREQLAYAVPFGLAALVEIAQGTYHQYAVARLFGAAVFAVYAVGCFQLPVLDLVAGPTANVMMVRMAEGRHEAGRARALWLEATRRLAVLFVPMAVFLALVAHDFVVVLFTEAYAAGAPVLRVWSATVLLAAFQTDAVLRVFAETRFLLALNVARLGLVAASLGALVAWVGLPGAALAAVAGLSGAKLAALLRVQRLLGRGTGSLLPWRGLAATAVCAGAAALAAVAARSGLEPGSLDRLARAGAAFSAVYVPLAWALVLSSEERRRLADLARRAVRGPRALVSHGAAR